MLPTVSHGLWEAGAFLMGRVTCEAMAGFWLDAPLNLRLVKSTAFRPVSSW